MVKQGRSRAGKFEPKSDELRSVRTIRLTNAVWEKLGQVANKQNMTRADLIEEWARQDFQQQPSQLTLFDEPQLIESNRETITKETRKRGTELALRLRVSSAALTNWLKSGNFAEKSKEHDFEDIAWERVPGTKMYRPIL